MALRIAQVTLVSSIQSIIKAFPTGIKAFLIGNESGLTCDVRLENGDEKILYPGTVDYFVVNTLFSGIIFVNPSINIQTAILYPSSTLWVDAVAPDDDTSSSSYPMALPRPMTAGTISPQKGFSTYVVFNITSPSTTNVRYMLNLFNTNALGSNIVAAIYALQIKSTGVGRSIGNISVRTDGTDNNFANTAAIINHNINGPVSSMHATFANAATIPAQNFFIFTTLLDNDLYDFAGPPDAYYLNPKQNLTMDIQDGSDLTMMAFKWTENS